jgi:hypothetical protein
MARNFLFGLGLAVLRHETFVAGISALDVRTFSSVLKGALVEGTNSVLCYDLNSTGFVQHVWFTMGENMAEFVTLSFFIDNEIEPSISFSPGVGLTSAAPEDNTSPWGSALHGRTGGGQGEGLFNSRQVPFGSRVRVVADFNLPTEAGIQSFFFIIRGLEALSPSTFPGIVVAGLQLPPTARLKLYSTDAANVGFLDYLAIANIDSGVLNFFSIVAFSF